MVTSRRLSVQLFIQAHIHLRSVHLCLAGSVRSARFKLLILLSTPKVLQFSVKLGLGRFRQLLCRGSPDHLLTGKYEILGNLARQLAAALLLLKVWRVELLHRITILFT